MGWLVFYTELSRTRLVLPNCSAGHSICRSQSDRRSCKLTSELLEILTCFRDLEINALALKGPAVAARAYGLFGRESVTSIFSLRPILERAWSRPKQRGYHTDPRNSHSQISPVKAGSTIFLFRERDGAIVELHWELNSDFERSPIEATGVWSRIQSVLLWDQPY